MMADDDPYIVNRSMNTSMSGCLTSIKDGVRILNMDFVMMAYRDIYVFDPRTSRFYSFDGIAYSEISFAAIKAGLMAKVKAEGLNYIRTSDVITFKTNMEMCRLSINMRRPRPYDIYFDDGILDMVSGEFRDKGDRDVFITDRLHVNYSDMISASEMDDPIGAAYLRKMIDVDDSFDVLMRCIGCFLFDKRRRFSPILYVYGEGGSGKSHIGNVLNAILGKKCMHIALHKLTNEFNLFFAYKDLIAIDEIKDGELPDSIFNSIKEVTSATRYTVTPKGKEPFEIMPDDKPMFYMTSNSRPAFKTDSGIERRLRIVRTSDVKIDDATYHSWETEDFMAWLAWQALQAFKRTLPLTEIPKNSDTINVVSTSEESVLSQWLEDQSIIGREDVRRYLMQLPAPIFKKELRDALLNYENIQLRRNKPITTYHRMDSDLDRLYGLWWYKQGRCYIDIKERRAK